MCNACQNHREVNRSSRNDSDPIFLVFLALSFLPPNLPSNILEWLYFTHILLSLVPCSSFLHSIHLPFITHPYPRRHFLLYLPPKIQEARTLLQDKLYFIPLSSVVLMEGYQPVTGKRRPRSPSFDREPHNDSQHAPEVVKVTNHRQHLVLFLVKTNLFFHYTVSNVKHLMRFDGL